MARKATAAKKPVVPFAVLRELHDVPEIGIREFRSRAKEACEAGVPLVITRGRYRVAAFIPIDFACYGDPGAVKKARQALLKSATAIADMLGHL